MASEEKKDLEVVFKPLLKELRFRKKGGTWWREVNGFIQVVNIQGSQFSKRFYLNLGVYISEIGDKSHPAVYDCHIRIRLDELHSANKVNELLNYEHVALGSPERNELATILKEYGIPWLNQCSCFDGAKAEYVLPNRVMTKHQREALDEYFA
ncbi:DUF4304 domain-containing protein [Microbulbifer sp. VTAC004]|uniref:DUF4304 domain-containing protein n=1 Tax=Microbulbifer sp. VTAC004 TaxID=3243386 RepID=UPI004039CC09